MEAFILISVILGVSSYILGGIAFFIDGIPPIVPPNTEWMKTRVSLGVFLAVGWMVGLLWLMLLVVAGFGIVVLVVWKVSKFFIGSKPDRGSRANSQ